MPGSKEAIKWLKKPSKNPENRWAFRKPLSPSFWLRSRFQRDLAGFGAAILAAARGS
jgi:hypothetical protein